MLNYVPLELEQGQGCIYVLCDPNTGQIRYIGQTAQSPKKRYRGHCIDRLSSTHEWIISLADQGQMPLLYILEIGDLAVIKTLELELIHQYGKRLLNKQGVIPNRPKPKEKIRRVQIKVTSKTKQLFDKLAVGYHHDAFVRRLLHLWQATPADERERLMASIILADALQAREQETTDAPPHPMYD